MKLTELEKKVIDNLNGCDTYDDMKYSCFEDISDQLGIDIKIIRGVVTSLIKKDIVSVQNCVSGCPPFVLLKNDVTF